MVLYNSFIIEIRTDSSPSDATGEQLLFQSWDIERLMGEGINEKQLDTRMNGVMHVLLHAWMVSCIS